jgi:hypothetical protein
MTFSTFQRTHGDVVVRLLVDETSNGTSTMTNSSCLGFETHPVTYLVLFGSMMVVPFYVFATYVQSKASTGTGLFLSWSWLVFGSGMSVMTLFDVVGMLGTPGNLLVPLAWFVPSFLACMFRKKLIYEHVLSQKWLVALQLFRSIGGLFLIEMARGNLAPIFAYAAGIGDLIVAVDAGLTLVRFRTADRIPGWAVYQLIVVGVLDFLSAFFFGFFSSENEAQLFFHSATNNPTVFPIGLVPLFLVPYAIFFHTLSYWNQRNFGTVQDPIYWTENPESRFKKDDFEEGEEDKITPDMPPIEP